MITVLGDTIHDKSRDRVYTYPTASGRLVPPRGRSTPEASIWRWRRLSWALRTLSDRSFFENLEFTLKTAPRKLRFSLATNEMEIEATNSKETKLETAMTAMILNTILSFTNHAMETIEHENEIKGKSRTPTTAAR